MAHYGREPQSITSSRTRTPEQETQYQEIKKAALVRMALQAEEDRLHTIAMAEYHRAHPSI